MKRPVLLAAEFAVAMLIASVAGWVANRFSRKENRQAIALERIAGAIETIATPPAKRYLAANIRIVDPPAPEPDPCPQVARRGR